MDNEITKINSSDIYVESQANKIQNKSTKHKKKLKTVVIILVILYGILSFFGSIPIPKLYIIADFYLNKNHFERVVNSDFDYINAFGDGIGPYISMTDDRKLKKSMRVIFKGTWRVMEYDDLQQVYIFYPFNFTDIKARGVLYYEGSDDLRYFFGDLDYIYSCKSLGNGWYYYETAFQNRE